MTSTCLISTNGTFWGGHRRILIWALKDWGVGLNSSWVGLELLETRHYISRKYLDYLSSEWTHLYRSKEQILTRATVLPSLPTAIRTAVRTERRIPAQQDVSDHSEGPQITTFVVMIGSRTSKQGHHFWCHELCASHLRRKCTYKAIYMREIYMIFYLRFFHGCRMVFSVRRLYFLWPLANSVKAEKSLSPDYRLFFCISTYLWIDKIKLFLNLPEFAVAAWPTD